jgi:hypothetical protein
MSLKTRLVKLESKTKQNKLVLIHVKDGETKEEAYKRIFFDNSLKPKKVLYLTDLDVNL